MPKLKNSDATFWVIFKHCACELFFNTSSCHKSCIIFEMGLIDFLIEFLACSFERVFGKKGNCFSWIRNCIARQGKEAKSQENHQNGKKLGVQLARDKSRRPQVIRLHTISVLCHLSELRKKDPEKEIIKHAIDAKHANDANHSIILIA